MVKIKAVEKDDLRSLCRYADEVVHRLLEAALRAASNVFWGFLDFSWNSLEFDDSWNASGGVKATIWFRSEGWL